MSVYTFRTVGVRLTVEADSLDLAYFVLDVKIDEAKKLGFALARSSDWELIHAY